MPNNTENNYERLNSDQISLLNKRIDSLNSNVFELKNQLKNQTEIYTKNNITWWEQMFRYSARDVFVAAGGYIGSPAGKNPFGSMLGGIAYDGFQKWLDDLLIKNKSKSDQTNNKSDYSMISYYDKDDNKIKFDRLQHLMGPANEFGIDSTFKSIGERFFRRCWCSSPTTK